MTTTTVNANATVETTEDMVIVPVRESVAVEIHALLENIGTSYLKIGALLNEARADFEVQKDFLSWAESEFSIKKAQCYNLMSVARCFEDNAEFTGVAMRVMLALVPHADSAEVMEKAAELAKAGELDTAAVNALIGKPAATKTNTVVAAIEQAQTAQAGAQVAESTQVEVGDNTAPFETSECKTQEDFNNAMVRNLVGHQAAPADNDRTAALLDTIKQLNSQIAEMQTLLNARTSEREARKSAAPMLPQFKSKCMYARLGLSAEEASKKTAINKARRELVKFGYGEGHDAYPLIEEAVTALLTSITE